MPEKPRLRPGTLEAESAPCAILPALDKNVSTSEVMAKLDKAKHGLYQVAEWSLDGFSARLVPAWLA